MIKIDYRKYQGARNLSWEILIKEKITKLPIDIVELCKKLNIEVKYNSLESGDSGSCTVVDGTPYIFVSQNCSEQRKRFTIAHELGHILLSHVGKYRLVNREPSPNDNIIEQEANVFASRLLAPACVLWGCKVKTAEEIAKLCDISNQAATFRMERMKILYKRDMFLKSPLERRVYKRFKKFILNHQHSANS